MNIVAGHRQPGVLWLLLLFLLVGLACAQAGEILTPAEATERAQADVVTGGSSDVEGEFAVGDTATLTGRNFLVNLVDSPGGRIVAGQERGATVTIEGIGELEGEIWYQITGGTGTGWVRASNLEAAEGADEGDGSDEGAIAVGDTVYLTGVGFLVNMYDEPGGRIVATQQRGADVTVLATNTDGGVRWYQIDAPTGEGWVPEENITTEAP